ncbi:MAG: peptidoglycan DD-metalloendopeptidase family protein [Coriobacteriales bacterium]|nr:peptidoglycan DD-metalloendopeptidase family protein [Coriobacteriales bacterium]
MHRSRAYLLALLTALLLVTAVPARAATQADVDKRLGSADAARAKARAADAKATKLAKEASKLDDKIDDLQADVDDLDPSIAKAQARVDRLRKEVQKLRRDIERTEAQIERTTRELKKQQTLLAARMATTYKNGEWYYIQLVLGSDDFGDLIARTELVSRVIRSNQTLAGDLEDTKGSLERDQVQLDRDLDAVSIKRKEAEAVASELREMQAVREARVAEQQSIFNAKSSMMAESKANAARYRKFAEEEEAEAARIASELGSRPKGSGKHSGSMVFPVPGGSVSSEYGWRTHPIFGKKKFHHGLDISAASGAAVLAADSGTVIKAESGWGGGYGNRVWVDHGEGVVTTYNHLKSFSVSSGEKVGKGQRIASVGSTGFSTGPHLHFEVRVNGDSRNPRNYF